MISHRLSRVKHVREDGWLSELVSVNYDDEPFSDIHTYIVSIVPGRKRANHYHTKKEEWIALSAGRIKIFLEDIRNNEKEQIVLDSTTEDYSIIHIPPFIAHAIMNIGTSEASIVVFSKNPEDKSDTFPYEVPS
jgi:dTDP-4-dehydrorhamnose 3,5-epimerase-like enzyme